MEDKKREVPGQSSVESFKEWRRGIKVEKKLPFRKKARRMKYPGSQVW